ncbi:hypothetical protein QFZ27_006799 [Inquilinus ginsengisoli]
MADERDGLAHDVFLPQAASRAAPRRHDLA